MECGQVRTEPGESRFATPSICMEMHLKAPKTELGFEFLRIRVKRGEEAKDVKDS